MRLALELCDSTITYRTRYLGQLQPAPVLDLVVLDDSNPRAFAFQMRSIDQPSRALGQASGTAVPDLLISLDEDLGRAVQLFAGEEKSWRHEGLALAVLREIAEDGQQRLEELSRGDHARLFQPRADGAGGRLVDGGELTDAVPAVASHDLHLRQQRRLRAPYRASACPAFPGQKVTSIGIVTHRSRRSPCSMSTISAT